MNAQQGTIQPLYLPVQVPCTSQPMQQAAEASSISAGCSTTAAAVPQQAPAEQCCKKDRTLTPTLPSAILASTMAANDWPRQHSLSEPTLLMRLAVSCREVEVARAEAPTVTLLACTAMEGVGAERLCVKAYRAEKRWANAHGTQEAELASGRHRLPTCRQVVSLPLQRSEGRHNNRHQP